MKNSKRIAAFLMAVSVVGMNVPAVMGGFSAPAAIAAAAAAESIKITQQPVDATVAPKKAATFAVAATGDNLTYLWKYKLAGTDAWVDWTSKTTASISVAYQASRNGMLLKCQITDGAGNTKETDTVTLRYNNPDAILITAQPADAVVAPKKAAPFAVEASGDNLTYLWKYQLAGSDEWVDWTSKTTADITVAYQASRDGMKLKCQITDGAGNTKETDTVTLTYATPDAIKITGQPADAAVAVKKAATFTVAATGDSLTYLWKYKLAGTDEWVDWTSKTTPSITVAYQAARDGMVLKCQITDAAGNTKETDEATLTYTNADAIKITAQPVDANVAVKKAATFTVAATGDSLTYLWKYKLAGTDEWVDWTSKTTASISVAYQAARDGMLLKCQITDAAGNTKETDTVTLTYANPDAIKITGQPADAAVPVKKAATFTVAATGDSLTYLWKYKLAGTDEWFDWTSKTTPSITVAYQAARDGMLLKCQITDGAGNTKETDTAVLTYCAQLVLTSPESAVILSGGSAEFSVSANNEIAACYWEQSEDGETWFAYSGEDASSPVISVPDDCAGMLYRCTVTDIYGQTATSDAALLTLDDRDTVCGDNLTYQLDGTTLILSGDGEMWSYTSAEASPFYGLNISTVIVPEGVTVIGAHAFENSNIETVVLPESVFSVRYRAFWNIPNLDITIENIGCAVYDEAVSETATVRGYEASAAYHCAQLETMTFISLDEEDNLDAATNKIVLSVGETYQIPAAGSGLKYYSFDPEMASVDETGLVTAVGAPYDDTDAKVMVYDKKGRSAVYYFAVVDEQSTPDYNWRYSVVSPAWSEKSQFVPFWGQRFSLNEDVAYISGWDNACPTGTFGTAPILSADDRGNAFVFYLTYDADIRPIEAETAYTEKTYSISQDWERTYYIPYYAYTAETDQHISLKAFGESDLNADVRTDINGDAIAWDYDGGRAELEFDVLAGQTVYIQCTAYNNDAFEYTLKLSSTEIELVQMEAGEVYTVSPSTAGELTTFAYSAPSMGTYLVESQSNRRTRFQVANNADFAAEEYDESGSAQANYGCWCYDVYSNEEDCRLLTCYPWVNEGETIYIRGWFDEEVDENSTDDYISFRVVGVSPMDTELVQNDPENPNYLAVNPEIFDRRTLTAEANTEYRITVDSRDVTLIIWDQNWNIVEPYTEMIDAPAEGIRYGFMTDEAQTYHLMVTPRMPSEDYGSVRLWVSSLQNAAAKTDMVFSQYNSSSFPVDYTFIASAAGYYYFDAAFVQGDSTSEYDTHFNINVLNAEGEQDWDRTFNYITAEESGRIATLYLEENETIRFHIYDEYLENDHIDFALRYADPIELVPDAVQSGEAAANGFVWYSFTAPAEGEYLFTASTDEGYIGMALATAGSFESRYDFDGHYDWYTTLAEGETVWVRIEGSVDEAANYRIVARNTEQAYYENLLAGLAWQNDPEASALSASEGGFTLDITAPEDADEYWNTSAFIAEFPVYAGNYYRLSLNIAGDYEGGLWPYIRLYNHHGAQEELSDDAAILPGTNAFSYCFTASASSGTAKLMISSLMGGTYTFSDIELVRVTEQDYNQWLREQESINYPYAHENYEGTVSADEPVWISCTVTDAAEYDVFELVNLYGDVTVEVYSADQETLYPEVYDQCDNHRRVYFENGTTTIWFKVTTENANEGYKFHFVKFACEGIAEPAETNDGALAPYSTNLYQFTAEAAGTYRFAYEATGMFNMELYLNNFTTGYRPMAGEEEDPCDGTGHSGYWNFSYETTISLEEGDTLYIRLTDTQYDETNSYTLTVAPDEETVENAD